MSSDYHRFNAWKLLAHADRLQAAARGEYPYPLDWHIYPSNVCNHACSWCMFRQNGEQERHAVKLDPAVMFRAVKDAARTGAKLVHFSGGGEPLLNPATRDAMQLAQIEGLKVALSTNGRHLNAPVVQQADYVRVSLNAGTRQTHDRVNHAGRPAASDWYQIIERIERVLPHRRRDLGLAFAVDHDNVEDIPAFVEMAAGLGVDFVHIRPAFWYEPELDAKTRAAMPRALALCEEARVTWGPKVAVHAITDRFDNFWSPRTYNRCRAIVTGTCLTATGDFAVCQDRTDLRFGAAYREGATFEEVWHSAEHRAVVERVVAGGELDACPRCVWNKRNELIEHALGPDDPMRLDLI